MGEEMKEMNAGREVTILESAVEVFGHQAQMDMAIEEMSELTKALLKYRRGNDFSEKALANIREEMADVSIMLNQLELIFGDYTEEEIGKLERLEELVRRETERRIMAESCERCAGMSFGEAIEKAKSGRKIAREGWNGKGQYVELAKSIVYVSPEGKLVNANHNAIGNMAFAFVGTSGTQMGWLASQADMLADDWYVV
ncbi:MAG: DUF2829 domain-containing protein [Oscillospiraceae bacterium]|nr:DUF2829 domain-containing protein [Oscillospiraceae bacterium]